MRLRTSGTRIVHVIALFFLINALTGTAFAGDYGQNTYGSAAPADSASTNTGRMSEASRPSSTFEPSNQSSRSMNRTTTRPPSDAAPSATPVANVPQRGETMTAVRAGRGAPRSRRGPVGHPPITRWDYDGYHVYFEQNRVIHTVVPTNPAPLHHASRLGTAD